MFKNENLRINIYFVLVLIAAFGISYNLFILTYIKHYSYSRTAQAQSQNISNILARGNIYMGEHLAATNKKFPLAYIVPSEINLKDLDDVSAKASSVLGIENNVVREIINSRADRSKVLVRRLGDSKVEAVKSLKIKGFGVAYENDRFYPGDSLAANVLGFLGYSGESRSGQYGIEAFYDDELFGKNWSVGGYISRGTKIDRPSDITLSIDKNIQQVIEDKLSFLIKKWEAAGGTIIIQEPNTGKILAMADRPTFDPNKYKEYDPRNFLNRSTQEIFEPGSSFKPITMAMGLDLGVVTPQTSFNDEGLRVEAGYKIKNFSEKIFGTVTMSQVLERSINTGAMFVQDKVGDKNFLDYAINFGFGQGTGIDLPGEVHGDISNLYSGRKINFLTASFGQGIAVTPIQLINAYSAIANGGKLMRPYIVEKIIKEGGKEEFVQPEIVSIPISEKTSAKLKSMLVSVVDNGFDKARISGYEIAGKTGTAQIPDGKGGYLESEYIHDFLGFAPAFNPKFVILIKIDRPHGITFAADSLSPTFKDLTQFLLNYYTIPPTRK